MHPGNALSADVITQLKARFSEVLSPIIDRLHSLEGKVDQIISSVKILESNRGSSTLTNTNMNINTNQTVANSSKGDLTRGGTPSYC